VTVEHLRVVVVEDHRALAEALAGAIELREGAEVVGLAASAAEFRALLADGQPFDAALVDLYLPDEDGAGLVREAREARPRARVVVLTNSPDPRDHERAIEAGAHVALSKAAPVDEVVAALRGPDPPSGGV